MIELQNVCFGYGRNEVLHQVNLRMANGEVVGLIGPNGAGKSTLLRLCARILRPQDGIVLVDGKPAAEESAKAFARKLAFLPQSRPVPAISVRSLVMLGRFAHGNGGHEAVERAMDAVGVTHLAERDVRTLSGGQRQMAYLAMLLAQESPHVLLDEPFTHLDIGAQLEVAQVIRRMKEAGKCVVVVMHDLNLLEQVCDRAVLMDNGKMIFEGNAADCLRSGELEQAFGVYILENQGISFEKR